MRLCLLRTFACALALAASAAGASGASHFTCHVTGTELVERLAPDGGPAELSRFTCQVRGGLLDGFVASGTNIWSGGQQRGLLLGSLVVARKGNSAVVYEVRQVTRERPGPAGGWQGRGIGVYKLASGAAAPLAGKTFHSVARSAGAGAFTIETVVAN